MEYESEIALRKVSTVFHDFLVGRMSMYLFACHP